MEDVWTVVTASIAVSMPNAIQMLKLVFACKALLETQSICVCHLLYLPDVSLTVGPIVTVNMDHPTNVRAMPVMLAIPIPDANPHKA